MISFVFHYIKNQKTKQNKIKNKKQKTKQKQTNKQTKTKKYKQNKTKQQQNNNSKKKKYKNPKKNIKLGFKSQNPRKMQCIENNKTRIGYETTETKKSY